MRTVVAIFLALLSLSASADTDDRLAALGRVWGLVKFAHPALAYRDIDWDAAGTKAVGRVLAGGDTGAYVDAVAQMLAALGDPMTRVAADCVPGTPAAGPASLVLADGTLVLRPASSALDPAAALRQAHRIIVDLRTPAGACSGPALPDALQRLLIRSEIALLAERQVENDGYKSQIDDSVYQSDFVVLDPVVISPGPAAAADRVVFIVDERSNVPRLALAMQRARRAAIVSVGPPLDDPFVGHLDISLGEGFHAVLRTGELLPGSGSSETSAVVSVPAGAGEAAIMNAATSLLATPLRRRAVYFNPGPPAPLPPYRWRADAAYPEMTFPPVEYRVLAAYRLWNIIEFFYGYKQLVDPWEPRLAPMIRMMIEARNSDDYGLAIGEWMTWIPDAHSYVVTRALDALRGIASPGFHLLPIGDDLVVAKVYDASASAAGVHPGDALIAVDGKQISERIDALARYTVAATAEATRYWIAIYAARGAIGSAGSFTFRRPNGQTYTASLTRYRTALLDPGPAPAKAWKVVSDNVGYVDLNFLQVTDIGRMFSELANTRGIVFDMRGYPNGVFYDLGRAMNVTGSSIIAKIGFPVQIGGVLEEQFFEQDIGKAQLLYTKKTAMLIDIEAVSQSEHTCLTLEAVNHTTFVGSPTEGSNGNVTVFTLPGNIYGQFTGMDVRHADGRQLQRVGVLPDITVYPTIDGLSQGKDEVLDRAVAFLTQ